MVFKTANTALERDPQVKNYKKHTLTSAGQVVGSLELHARLLRGMLERVENLLAEERQLLHLLTQEEARALTPGERQQLQELLTRSDPQQQKKVVSR